jgi:organic hydroperoxide reductase OsmC/OhrA
VGRTHTYDVTVTWTGNTGRGTSTARDYARDHKVPADGPPPIAASLHEAAHRACFIANSVNFPVRCEPAIISS